MCVQGGFESINSHSSGFRSPLYTSMEHTTQATSPDEGAPQHCTLSSSVRGAGGYDASSTWQSHLNITDSPCSCTLCMIMSLSSQIHPSTLLTVSFAVLPLHPDLHRFQYVLPIPPTEQKQLGFHKTIIGPRIDSRGTLLWT